jgi:hypothetical protein
VNNAQDCVTEIARVLGLTVILPVSEYDVIAKRVENLQHVREQVIGWMQNVGTSLGLGGYAHSPRYAEAVAAAVTSNLKKLQETTDALTKEKREHETSIASWAKRDQSTTAALANVTAENARLVDRLQKAEHLAAQATEAALKAKTPEPGGPLEQLASLFAQSGLECPGRKWDSADEFAVDAFDLAEAFLKEGERRRDEKRVASVESKLTDNLRREMDKGRSVALKVQNDRLRAENIGLLEMLKGAQENSDNWKRMAEEEKEEGRAMLARAEFTAEEAAEKGPVTP